jgi:prolyl-tRNA synthetase
VWPKEVAPFAIHIIALGTEGSAAYKEAENIYRQCVERGIEVLFDDRDLRAGEKFADADLIGIPLRVVVSDKTIAEGKVEVKERRSETARLTTPAELFFHLETTKP